jgi:uncharacterized protein YegL
MKFLSLFPVVILSLTFPIGPRSADAPSVSARVQENFEKRLSAFAELKPQAEPKVAYAILLDNSGSMRRQIDVVLNLGKGIVEQTQARGPISVFTFKPQKDKRNLSVASDIQWSDDKNLLDRYIDSIFVIGGQTTLIDAVDAMAEQLNAKVDLNKDAFAEKVIFLVTDGEDRTSHTSEKELIAKLKASGIKVYAIGLVTELDKDRGVIRQPTRGKSETFLKKITKESGGRVVFPESGKVNVEETLNELYPK